MVFVKSGEVLENGLVVKSAHCSFEENNYIDGTMSIDQSDSEVVFLKLPDINVSFVLYV